MHNARWVGGSIGRRGFPILGNGKRGLSTYVKELFKNGEQGFFYDPNDLSTMYQDSAGTIPVTAAGQPVGLMLDKSKGLLQSAQLLLSPNDITNAAWFKDAVAVTLASGVNIVTPDTTSAIHRVSYQCGSTAGQATRVECTLKAGGIRYVAININSWTNIRIGIDLQTGTITGNTGNTSITDIGGGWYKIIIQLAVATTTNTSSRIWIQANNSYTSSDVTWASNGTNNFQIGYVNAWTIAGNHSYQTTSSMRPLLQNTPRRIQYDGIDDKLTTNLPAQLTGCTVIRAIPNVGCQILTNQTIATPYNDSTPHCGLIVINRALTAYETSTITQLFNKLAGV